MKRRNFFAALAGLAVATFAGKSVARESDCFLFRGHKIRSEPTMHVDYMGIDANSHPRWRNYTSTYGNPPDKHELIHAMREAIKRTRFIRPLKN